MVKASGSKATPAPRLVLDRSVLDTFKASLNPADLKRLLDLTMTEFPVLLERVSAAWRADDPIDVANQAHKITGVAASFGVTALSVAADRIERACRTARQIPGTDMLDDLASATGLALGAIAAWRAEHAI